MEAVAQFRGLVHKAALLLIDEAEAKGIPVEDDFDDIVQFLWIKAWRAWETFDPEKLIGGTDAHGRGPRERYVFFCVRNGVKDVLKKKRRGELSLDELTSSERVRGSDGSGFQSRDSFDAKYLAVDDGDAYELLEAQRVVLPNTLTAQERAVVTLLAADYSQAEARTALSIEKREMERVMRRVREKLADWKPSAPANVVFLPTRSELPLPVAA